MIKLGVLDVSNMNLHELKQLNLTSDKQNVNDRINKDGQYNFYELYIKPIDSESPFSSIDVSNSKKRKKRNYEMKCDLINYVKENGLTIRQAQKLFIECADYILDKHIQ